MIEATKVKMSHTETWRAWEGRVIDGKFPLRQWLGGSDHSAVFLTERAGIEPHKAAIKLIAADVIDAERQLARLHAAAQISHPNLIRIFSVGRCQFDGTPLLYLVMEYAEENLAQILPQRQLTTNEVSELLPPVLNALSCLHKEGYAHSRIKPSNILAVGDQLKLSADQIMPVADASSTGNRRDVYDAPETAAGIISPEGDLWSVGVTLVAALTQNVSFGDEQSQPNPALLESIPEPYGSIARECLQLDPKQRSSISFIRSRLQPSRHATPAIPPAAAPQHPSANGKTLAVIVVVIALLVGLFLYHSRSENSSARPSSGLAQSVPPASAPAPAPPVEQSAAPPQSTSASKGAIVRQVLPDVPRSAKDTITGTIKISVRVEVDPSGRVTSAKLISPGPSKYFANQALKAAQRWEFSPPEVNGQPAASAWILHFRLRRTSIQVSPERANR
jgi:TonB family protein